MTGQQNSWIKRKLDHVNLAMEMENPSSGAGFSDVRLLHCSLPSLNLGDIDITCDLFGKKLQAPIVINALTGGAEELAPLNKTLARVAAKTGIAMAVGSQAIALKNEKLAATFRVVRENNNKGVILANLGAGATPEEAVQAVEMIGADGLQIHLNIPQELIMTEGDRTFKSYLDNIIEIVNRVKVPVIVKEVGFGISREVAETMIANGVSNIDIGGFGGTNFIAIENKRNKDLYSSYLEEWGISTVCSLVEVSDNQIPGKIIATGGIRNPLDVAKAIALGADLAGIAGIFIRRIKEGTETNLVEFIEIFKEGLKKILLMTGSGNLKQLQKKPVIITGFSKEWLNERGIMTNKYAQR